nr:DUF2520 domain-containing protein [Saprospiraceae bacterium]
MINDIIVLGYGNLGYHLVDALSQLPDCTVTVYVRKLKSIDSKRVNSSSIRFVNHLEDLPPTAPLCFAAVKDDAIHKVCKSLPKNLLAQTSLIHCSGVLPANHLSVVSSRWALFYPLNSFSKDHSFSWEKVPVFIDGADPKKRKYLWQLAEQLSARPVENNDRDRAVLHLAAVMVNNFTNHLYQKAEELLSKHQIPFHYLIPLIKTTTSKLDYLSPAEAQTGPAARGDVETIRKHLGLIEDENLKSLYLELTHSINPDLKT